jgi:hypothetical protein
MFLTSPLIEQAISPTMGTVGEMAIMRWSAAYPANLVDDEVGKRQTEDHRYAN